jgi:hypothetical protein
MTDAPKDGRVILARGHDFGQRGGKVTQYRCRWFLGAWREAALPNHELEHLEEWTEAEPRIGAGGLFDALPLSVLDPHMRTKTELLDVVTQVEVGLAAGMMVEAGRAVAHLAAAVAAAQQEAA